jgi:hypothetical protein
MLAEAGGSAASPDVGVTPAKVDWAKILIIPTVTALFGVMRAMVGRVPGTVIVVGAPLLGALLEVLGTYSGAWDSSGALGALLGANAVWLHQLGKQAIPKPAEAPSPPLGN